MNDKEFVELLEEVRSEIVAYNDNDVFTVRDILDLINRLNERNKKNERIIELADKTIRVQSAEIEKVKETNRFYERSRLNCQILNLEAFSKTLKNVFVNIGGTFECWEIEDHIDDFLNRTVNEAKKDYRAICQDDKSSYDLINKTKSEAIKEFAERIKKELHFISYPLDMDFKTNEVNELIDNLVKEMTENITKVEHNSLCETETYKGGE